MEIDMSKTKTLTLIVIFLIILTACIDTTIQADPTRSDGSAAPTAASTPPAYNGSSTPEPTEIESGAVFEIPDYWYLAEPTRRPIQKGRSNYQ